MGIRSGDIISKIEGESTHGVELDDAVKKLRGPKGSEVTISITRAGYDQPSFSHFASSSYWHTGAPNSGEAYGWYGRTADALDPVPCQPHREVRGQRNPQVRPTRRDTGQDTALQDMGEAAADGFDFGQFRHGRHTKPFSILAEPAHSPIRPPR